MSVDYHVAVHAANWPTMQVLQQCIDQREWPIKLGTKNNLLWTTPFASAPQTLGLPVIFDQESIELEARFVTLSSTESFGYQLGRQPDVGANDVSLYHWLSKEALKPLDISETLLRIGASGVTFNHGDRVFSLSFRSNFKEYQAGAYIMAALIICFNGYGFELQGGQHGTSEYADMLLKDASENREQYTGP